MQLRAGFREAAEDHAEDGGRRRQHIDGRGDGDARGAVGGKAIDAGGNGGKRNRYETLRLTKLDRAAIAGCQCLGFTLPAALPDRTDRMNDVACRKVITFGDLDVAGLATIKRAAFRNEFRASDAMDRAVNAAATEQRCIRSVDDGVNAQRRDVGDDDFQPRRTDLALRMRQAEAAALTATPLSARSCCNSPAWNISRMMSQPPTNSPLT